MEVQKFTARFTAIDDNDLKYMMLKEPITLNNVYQDFVELIAKVVIPVFEKESNEELIELVSGEFIPNIVQGNLVRFTNENHNGAFISRIILPLLNHECGRMRRVYFVQCVRNIMKNTTGVPNDPSLNFDDSVISTVLAIIQKDSNLFKTNKILFWEILKYAFQNYHQNIEDGSIARHNIDTIITLIKDESLQNVTKDLLQTIIESLKCGEIYCHIDLMNFDIMQEMSIAWYKFGGEIETLLFQRILMPHLNFSDPNLPQVLQIIVNLHFYYDTNVFIPTESSNDDIPTDSVVSPPSRYLSNETISQLNFLLNDALNNLSEYHNAKELSNEGTAIPMELDQDEEDYLNDLGASEEDEDVFHDDEDVSNYHEEELIDTIKCIQESLQEKNKPLLPEKIDLLQKNISGQYHDNMKELETIVNDVESNFQILERHHNELFIALLPLLKYNKNFIEVIKVGNLKQSIDQSVDLKLSTLKLIDEITLDYSTSCQLLQELVFNNMKENTNSAIIKLSTKIVSKLILKYGKHMQCLNPHWFNETVISKVTRRLQKCQTSLQQQHHIHHNNIEQKESRSTTTHLQTIQFAEYNESLLHVYSLLLSASTL